ncbi:hypothetical protein H0B56_02455 [Haloechinothrix sp. YIM 98757]|uniref:Uncharacterized protein n=1 Tax=Haloechinothrix aidingensis TaxID=2752311 RepID=A0A838A7U4_9PSEU|nr:hypothetical protein [Haloechinothrix aidingensis]MBA0124399.1 hypothetical protein [Haloechinothrix aidingensis]
MTMYQHAMKTAARGPQAFCEWCGHTALEASLHQIVVADSSYVDPTDFTRDGRRRTHACCTEHASRLMDYGTRTWNDEQFWHAKLRRATRHCPQAVPTRTPEQLASQAGLTAEQLARALRWKDQLHGPHYHRPVHHLSTGR